MLTNCGTLVINVCRTPGCFHSTTFVFSVEKTTENMFFLNNYSKRYDQVKKYGLLKA